MSASWVWPQSGDRPTLDAFRMGLQEQDLVEGRTILMEARHAGGDLSLATRIIEELIRKPVDAPSPQGRAARSIRRATDIPIVAIRPSPEWGLNHAGFSEAFWLGSRGSGRHLPLSVVARFGFGRGHGADGLEQPAVV